MKLWLRYALMWVSDLFARCYHCDLHLPLIASDRKSWRLVTSSDGKARWVCGLCRGAGDLL